MATYARRVGIFNNRFIANLLWNQRWKNFENRLSFDRYHHEYDVSLFYGTRCIPMWLFILEFAKLQFSLVNVLWTNLLSIQLVRRASRHTSLHFAATDRNRTLYVRSTRAIVSFKRKRYGVEHSRQIATELFPKHRWTDWTEHLTVRAQPCSIEVFTFVSNYYIYPKLMFDL